MQRLLYATLLRFEHCEQHYVMFVLPFSFNKIISEEKNVSLNFILLFYLLEEMYLIYAKG